MKHTTKLILPAVLIFALSLTGCPQAGTNPGENSGTNPAVPSNPNELVESDVLTAFGLQRGSITASAAAKKIATDTPAGGITFTQKTAVSYDDQAGTFTVKVKGTKSGRPFEKELTFSGFSNPYAANPQSMDTTGGKGELKLDEGIEHNHSIENYTGKAKNLNIANFFQAPLTFSLVNGTSITLGDFPGYKLTAALVQEGNDKVKIVPEYTVKNHKKIAGGTPTVTEETKYSVFPSAKFADNLTKPYFTEKDVFAYVLSKTNDSVIKVYPNEFASSFYAFAKIAETAPGNLFDTSAIDPYTALYQTKDADEYMQLDITCGIHDPKNGGIDADDYKGELTVRFCIATHEQLANKELITAVKLITRSGYASIPDNAALAKKDHLFFNLIPKAPLSPTDKTKWKNRDFSRSLLRINESGAAIIDNPFSGSDSLFYLFVNSSDPNPAAYLGSAGAAYGGASKTKNNKVIFIEHIQLEKKSGNESLEVQVTLKGSGSALKVTAEP